MILAGDIGGTSSRLAFFEIREGRLRLVTEETFPSREHRSLEEIARAFAAPRKIEVTHACFGVPGPVRDGRVVTSNLPWVVEAEPLIRALGAPHLRLINDLEASAHGVAALQPEDLVTLNAGAPDAQGNQAVIAVGTGLGEAGLFWDGRDHWPFACEGGHADFPARHPLETELMLHLRAQFQRVSCERVLSGPGLVNIYEFLKSTGRGEEPAWLTEALEQGDPSAVISNAGLEGRCPLCARALGLFVAAFGAEAGNLALKTMAVGGVFLAGGVAPKILRALRAPAFLEAFTDKGRMRPLMEAMPVRVVLNEAMGLLGAARVAARLAGERV